MASINVVRRAILVKREQTPGSAETLTATNGVKDMREFGFIEPNFNRLDDRNVVKTTFGPSKARHDLGGATQGISIAIPVRAPAANGDLPPDIAELLIACGLAETVNAGTSVVYAPSTPNDITQAPSATVGLYEAGKAHTLAGARANLTLSGQPGQELLARFSVRAPWADPVADQTEPSVADPTGQPLLFAGAVAITEDGSSVDIGTIEIDLGNELEDDVNNVGVRVLRKDFNPVIRINPLAVATATEWDKLTGGGEIAIVATWNGLVFNAPKCQLVEMGSEESSGRVRRAKTWQMNETNGDDQFTITFTAPA